jgi:hypothetical protein
MLGFLSSTMTMAVNMASYKMKLFRTICLFLIIVNELLLVNKTKKKNATVSHPPQVSLYVPVTIVFRYVKLQHNMTDIKQVHL